MTGWHNKGERLQMCEETRSHGNGGDGISEINVALAGAHKGSTIWLLVAVD